MKHIVFLFLLASTALHCTNQNCQNDTNIIEYIDEIMPHDSLRRDLNLIIPKDACHSCVEQIYGLIDGYFPKKQTKINIILAGKSKCDSLQLVKREIPATVILDRRNDLYRKQYNVLFPTLIYETNNEFTSFSLIAGSDNYEQQFFRIRTFFEGLE